jgi:hypothetical protein
MPSVVIVVAFALLCARECTALPWLTFIIAPVVSLALGTLAGIPAIHPAVHCVGTGPRPGWILRSDGSHLDERHDLVSLLLARWACPIAKLDA